MARKTKMNSITSPELLAQVNPENKQLLSDFLDYMRSVQRSETTIAGYENDIQIAFVWAVQNIGNAFFVNWTKRNIVAYQNWLLNNNENSPARIRRLKASLSSLSNYIECVLDDEFPNFRNIINKVESPVNQPTREKTVLTDDDVNKLLSSFVERGNIEAACGVALMAFGGRRKSEICRFRVSDFDDDKLVCEGSLWKSDPIKTKGRGNGKFLNCYTLVHKFKPYLDMWINYRDEHGIGSEWLFPDANDFSKQMPISTINSWMITASKIMDMPIYAHAFRHRYTTMLSEEGIPDNVIKEIQGWSSLELVSVYVDTSAEKTLDKYFGKDGIKKVETKGLSEL